MPNTPPPRYLNQRWTLTSSYHVVDLEDLIASDNVEKQPTWTIIPGWNLVCILVWTHIRWCMEAKFHSCFWRIYAPSFRAPPILVIPPMIWRYHQLWGSYNPHGALLTWCGWLFRSAQPWFHTICLDHQSCRMDGSGESITKSHQLSRLSQITPVSMDEHSHRIIHQNKKWELH